MLWLPKLHSVLAVRSHQYRVEQKYVSKCVCKYIYIYIYICLLLCIYKVIFSMSTCYFAMQSLSYAITYKYTRNTYIYLYLENYVLMYKDVHFLSIKQSHHWFQTLEEPVNMPLLARKVNAVCGIYRQFMRRTIFSQHRYSQRNLSAMLP